MKKNKNKNLFINPHPKNAVMKRPSVRRVYI